MCAPMGWYAPSVHCSFSCGPLLARSVHHRALWLPCRAFVAELTRAALRVCSGASAPAVTAASPPTSDRLAPPAAPEPAKAPEPTPTSPGAPELAVSQTPAAGDATVAAAPLPEPEPASNPDPEPAAPASAAASADELPSVRDWGEKVFRQFDTDKDGNLSKKELLRALRSLPKKKPKTVPPGTKFMSLNELVQSLDSDGDGGIDLQEWLDNLAACAGLAAAIAENINEVGEIPTFLSYEQQQAKLKTDVQEVESRETRTEEDELLLEDLKRQILNLQAKIEEAAANQLKLHEWGRTTFAQFDTDHNGTLSPKELAQALNALPRRKPKNIPPGSKFMSIDEMMEAMDGDGDGSIDVDEWLERLGTCAGLAAALAENVNEDGKLANFVEPAE